LITAEVERARQLAHARECLIFRRHDLLAEGQELPPEEMRILQTACPKPLGQNPAIYNAAFAKWLRHEEARVVKILALQDRAGTPGVRQADDAHATVTAEALVKQGPTIREQILVLQANLDDLHQAATNAEQQGSSRRQAVIDLKSKALLPDFVLDELAANHRRNTAVFEREMIKLGVRQTQIKGILTLDVATAAGAKVAQSHVSSLERFGRTDRARVETFFTCTTRREGANTHWIVGGIRSEIWAGYLTDLGAEQVAVAARLQEIIAGPAAEAQAADDRLRSFYVPK